MIKAGKGDISLMDELYANISPKFNYINKVNSWPLFKIQIGYILLCIDEGRIDNKLKNFKFEFKPSKFTLSDFYKILKVTFRKKTVTAKYKNVCNNKVLLFGFKEHYYMEEKNNVNLYLTPFKEELSKIGIGYEEFPISNLEGINREPGLCQLYEYLLENNRNVFYLRDKFFQLNKKAYENALLVKIFLDEKKIEYSAYIGWVIYHVQIEHEIRYTTFIEFLRIINPKIIWTYCYYDNTVMALIRAANKINISIVEYQHSVQSDSHNAYSKWPDIEKYKSFFPDIFWLWKQEDAERVLENFSGIKYKAKVATGGNIALIQQLERSLHKSSKSDNGILVCLQGLWIPAFVEEIIKNDINHLWYFRLHPRYQEDNEKLTDLKARFPEKIEINDANTLPIYELYNRTSISITDYSGAAIEAEEFGLKIIITGEKGAEIYKEKISQGKYMLCDNSDKLQREINREFVSKEESVYSIIKNRANLDKAIKTIFSDESI